MFEVGDKVAHIRTTHEGTVTFIEQRPDGAITCVWVQFIDCEKYYHPRELRKV